MLKRMITCSSDVEFNFSENESLKEPAQMSHVFVNYTSLFL